MKVSKNTTIGIVVIVTLGILIWGIQFLKGFNIFSSEQLFYAKYEQVDGLKVSSPVTLRGYKIGQIKAIEFSPSASHLTVEFSITNEFQLPDNTEARIVSSDIMGTKEIRLMPGKSKNMLQSGDTLSASIESDLKEQVSMQMLPLKKKAENLISSVDSVLAVIQYIFNEDTRQNLRHSFSSIEQTLQRLENTASVLNEIISGQKAHIENTIANIDLITGNLKQNNGQITSILENFSSLSDSLKNAEIATVVNKAKQALEQSNQILEKMNSGEGSIGMLINNDTLYMNLEAASNSLTNLLLDLKNNPKRYVHFSLFGTGKTVYIDSEKPSKKQAKNKQNYCQVQLFLSKTPVALNAPMFKGYKNVSEIYRNGVYRYVLRENKNRKEINKQMEKIRKDFPNAFIIE